MVVFGGANDRGETILSICALIGLCFIWNIGLKTLRVFQPRQFYKLDISSETIRLYVEDDSGTVFEIYNVDNTELTPYHSFVSLFVEKFLAPLNIYFFDSAGKKLWAPLFMDNENDSLTVFEIVESGKQATYRLSVEQGQLNAFRRFAPEAKYDGKYVDVHSGLW
jgi:hypothetical protein